MTDVSSATECMGHDKPISIGIGCMVCFFPPLLPLWNDLWLCLAGMVSWRGRVLKSHGNRNRRNSTATCWKRTSWSHVFNCTTVNKENTHTNKQKTQPNSLCAVSCKWTVGILLTRQAEQVPAGEYTSPSASMETGITCRWHLWSTSKLRKMWWIEEGVFSRSGWLVVCSNRRWLL